MSTFVVGGTTCTFIANQDGFDEQMPTLLRTWDFEALLDPLTTYGSLRGLLSYPVSIRTCPGSAGATMVVDVAGGNTTTGSLTLDNVVDSPFNALLVRINRPSAYPGGGQRCHVTFQEVPT